MKECPNCKTTLEDDELFCHECGAKQEIEDGAAQNEETAAPQEDKCIHCGEAIEAGSAFCPFCGKPQTVDNVKSEEQKEKAKVDEKPGPKEAPVQEEPVEQTTYEWEEEKKSKKWIWILMVALLAGIGAWYYLSQDDSSSESEQNLAEAVDTTPIDEPDVIDEYEEIKPTSPLAFLEQFYKGEYEKEEYIKQHVTANVLNKLKRDYENECPSGDCLATWVFTAYPPGSDLYLEEGPIITESKEEGKYSVYYSYYTQGQSGRIYKPRGLLVSVTQIDGEYQISDYELVMPDVISDQDNMSDNNEGDDDSEVTIVQDGDYYLTDGKLRLNLQKRNSVVNGDFYFYDGSDRSAKYFFKGNLDDNNYLNADVYCIERTDRKEGTINGFFNGEEFNVRVCLNYDRYNDNYELKVQ